MPIVPSPAMFGAAGALGLFGERGGLGRPLIRSQAPLARPTDSLSANFTFHVTWALECEFDLVRLVYGNTTATPYTLTAAAVAPSAKVNNGFDPVTADDAPVTWTTMPTNAAGADGLAPSPSGGATSLTVPASPATDQAIFAFTDWLRLSSLPRADGGDGRPLLMTRSHFAATGARRSMPSADAWPTENRGRILRAFYKAGGNFTTAGFTSPVANDSFIVPSAVQYYARSLGGTVVAVGDSLTQGTGLNSNDLYSWGHYATAQISTPTRPVAFINGGWHGQTSTQFLQNARTYIDVFRADVIAISVWTPNDPRTMAAANSAWQNVMEVAAYAQSKGCLPVLATAVPYNLSVADDAIRNTINARARAIGAAGAMLVADLDVAVSDGATPAKVPPPLLASGAHLTPAGYAQMGAAAAPVIARALSALSLRVPVQL
jgi:lysophospholipase L1-like esterase